MEQASKTYSIYKMKTSLSPFSIITIFISLAIVGGSLIPLLSIQLKPSSAVETIEVSFSWPDASAKIIEQEVTSKLEGLFNRMQEVKDISSTSQKGSGSISINFKKNTDMDAVRFELATLIRQAYVKLPHGISYPHLSMGLESEGQSSILSYSINANGSPYFIKKYVDENLVPKLSLMDGISEVNVYGAAPYEWVITYDAHKLFELGISASEVSQAINIHFSRNELGRAKVTTNEKKFSQEISVSLEYHDPQKLDFEGIVIGTSGERVIYLRDIAKVRFQEGPVNAYYRINGKNTINMVIFPEKGVNSIRLSRELKEYVKELEQTMPPSYQLKLTYDPISKLSEDLQKIKWRSFFSLVILLIFTIVFYRNAKYIGIFFLSIFINLLVAVILYYLFEIDLQLYSFAGITISFGIIIDNTIIMMDHLRKNGDKRAFLAILAATLTTIGAVMVIFFLEESQRANLWDFALVIAINLGISLLVALYLVPALMQKFQLEGRNNRFSRKRKRRLLWVSKKYAQFLENIRQPFIKWTMLLIVILGFGLPLHLAPDKIEGKGVVAKIYNHTLGEEWFRAELRPGLEKYLGGSLRLFIENVFENSYYAEPERTSLRVSGRMPEGHTIEQLNDVIRKMERYIGSFEEVELFETRINSYRNSSINIYFKEEDETGSFPYALKSLLESKAISLGGLDWSVTGVGRGFSNALGNSFKSDRIHLEGYNYDNLYNYAELLGEQLLDQSNGRVKEIEIRSGGRNTDVFQEYYLEFDPEKMTLSNIGASQMYNALRNQLHYSLLQPVINNNDLQDVKLVSNRYENMKVWDLNNEPLIIGEDQYKIGKLATITRKKTGNTISKKNQQYQLTVEFDFIGPRPLAQKFKEERIEELSQILPIGYKVTLPSYEYWNKKDKKQYYYLFVIVGIIFFICSILLESLIQPLAIISMIPISFIGVFLTFYMFDFNFDQGGYASFILLSGISVNAALYIVNDFNILKKKYPKKQYILLYLKAYNHKIIPILITIMATIGGLIPFVWSGQEEVFWFSFAAGSIGGLLFSLIGICLYLPLLVYRK